MTTTLSSSASDDISQKPFYNVRHVEEKDIPCLHEVSESVYGKISAAGRFNMRQRYHAANGGLFLTAENGEHKPVGYLFATSCPSSDKVFVWELAVHNKFRKAGIGESLMYALQKEALDLGCKSIELHCDPDNVTAKRLYKRCGYYAVDMIRDYAFDSRQMMRVVYTKNLFVT